MSSQSRSRRSLYFFSNPKCASKQISFAFPGPISPFIDAYPSRSVRICVGSMRNIASVRSSATSSSVSHLAVSFRRLSYPTRVHHPIIKGTASCTVHFTLLSFVSPPMSLPPTSAAVTLPLYTSTSLCSYHIYASSPACENSELFCCPTVA